MVTERELQDAISTITTGLEEIRAAGHTLLMQRKAWKEARNMWEQRCMESAAAMGLAEIILREPKMIPTNVTVEQALAMAMETARIEGG